MMLIMSFAAAANTVSRDGVTVSLVQVTEDGADVTGQSVVDLTAVSPTGYGYEYYWYPGAYYYVNGVPVYRYSYFDRWNWYYGAYSRTPVSLKVVIKTDSNVVSDWCIPVFDSNGYASYEGSATADGGRITVTYKINVYSRGYYYLGGNYYYGPGYVTYTYGGTPAPAEPEKPAAPAVKFKPNLLLATVARGKNMKLKIGYCPGADTYNIYYSLCGGQPLDQLEPVAVVGADTRTYWVKDLEPGKQYKFMVEAYKGEDLIATSYTAHNFVGESEKYGHTISVQPRYANLTVKVGEKKAIDAKVIVSDGKKLIPHTSEVRFRTSDNRVADVTPTGTITGISKGQCTIYSIAADGVSGKTVVTVE